MRVKNLSLFAIFVIISLCFAGSKSTSKMPRQSDPSTARENSINLMPMLFNRAVDDLDSLFGLTDGMSSAYIDRDSGNISELVSDSAAVTRITVDSGYVGELSVDTILYPVNEQGRHEYGIMKTSKVTIGHVGETTTDFAFTTAENTTEQTIPADTIPAYARILDVWIVTTEAVAGITGSFTVDIGDGTGTDEWATATDIKAANAGIGSDASEALLIMPIATATIIWVNATPAAEDWDQMSAGEFSLYVTYLDYGSIK